MLNWLENYFFPNQYLILTVFKFKGLVFPYILRTTSYLIIILIYKYLQILFYLLQIFTDIHITFKGIDYYFLPFTEDIKLLQKFKLHL